MIECASLRACSSTVEQWPFKPLVESSSLSTLTNSPTLTPNKVFNIILADVPEKKTDLVEGKYLVEAKKGATIAVKVTDMLGEEVLVVKSL